MIPLVAWIDFVNAIVAGILAVRFWISYKKSSSYVVKLCAIAYIFFALDMFFLSSAGLLTANPEYMLYTSMVSYVLLYLASIMIIQIPFAFMRHDVTKYILTGMLIIASIFGIYEIVTTSKPHQFVVIGRYAYWQPMMAPLARIFSGVITLTATIVFTATFLWLRRQSIGNALAYRRSTRMVYGMALLVIGSILGFIVGAKANFYAIISSTIIILLGLLTMADGILYEERIQH